MGERKATLTLKNAGGTLTGTQGADGNSGEIFDGTVERRRRRLENLDHQPDAADARLHRQGFRRQHVRRNGHRPDGQLPVHGDAGVRDPRGLAAARTSVVITRACPVIHVLLILRRKTWMAGSSPAMTRRRQPPHPKFNSLKKSLPLSSMMMKAGKSTTSMRQIASMPSSGYSTTSTFLMQCSARFAAAPPIEPR